MRRAWYRRLPGEGSGNLLQEPAGQRAACSAGAASATVLTQTGGGMFSQSERRRLDAIERQLTDEDPDLAQQLANWRPHPASARWATFAAVTAVLLSTLGMLLGLLLLSPAVFVPSGVLLLGAWVWLARRIRCTSG